MWCLEEIGNGVFCVAMPCTVSLWKCRAEGVHVRLPAGLPMAMQCSGGGKGAERMLTKEVCVCVCWVTVK